MLKVLDNIRILGQKEGFLRVVQGALVIDGAVIRHVGPASQVGASVPAGTMVIDGQGKLVLPGMINAHTHSPMSLLRGYGDDLPLHQWLHEKIFPAEDRMTEEDAYWGAMLSIAEMILSGTTCFIDMYFHMDAVARAVGESGIRAVLGRGLAEAGGQAKLEQGIVFAGNWRNTFNGRITTMMAPHAPYTCSPEYLRKVSRAAQELGVPVHIHVSETRGEVEDMLRTYGKRPVHLLEEAGLLETPLLVAHGVHLDHAEMDLLAAVGASVAHCPSSNLKLASGMAPIVEMQQRGLNVALGTDSAASNNRLDMFQELRLASYLAKGVTTSPEALPAAQALAMATRGSAVAAGLADSTGVLEPGYKADLIMLDLQHPHLGPDGNLPSILAYSATGSDVCDVMVNGEWLMRSRKLLTIDVVEVMGRCGEIARRLTESG